MIERLEKELLPLREVLKKHEIYKSIHSIEDIHTFMSHHVFAVWDFMSLLKQLQNLLSCNSIPWRPSGNPAASRLINEIVWGEESDVNRHGIPMSHYEMYLEAMQSLEVDASSIHGFIKKVEEGKTIESILNESEEPSFIIDFLRFTFEVVYTNQAHIIAAVFTFGREDLIPDMFVEIIKTLKPNKDQDLKDLVYYFERHIEVDADEHGPMALEMVSQLCGDDPQKWEEALEYSKKALEFRIQLWNGVYEQIRNTRPIPVI
jgi:hypothetical protein